MLHFRLRALKHYFCCKILKISEAEIPTFPVSCDFVPKADNLCFKKVIRLDGRVAFSQIEPKTQILEWELVVVALRANGIRKSRKCQFSNYEIDDFESRNPHFRKINNVLCLKVYFVRFEIKSQNRENFSKTYVNDFIFGQKLNINKGNNF